MIPPARPLFSPRILVATLGFAMLVGAVAPGTGCRVANPYADSDPLAHNAALEVYGVKDHDAYVQERMMPNLNFRGGSGELVAEPGQYVLTVQGVPDKVNQMEIRRQVYDFNKRTWFNNPGGNPEPMKPVLVKFDTDKDGTVATGFTPKPGDVGAISAEMAAKRVAMEEETARRDAAKAKAAAEKSKAENDKKAAETPVR